METNIQILNENGQGKEADPEKRKKESIIVE